MYLECHVVNSIFFKLCTAFEGHRVLLSGPLIEIILTVKNTSPSDNGKPILVFDDATGGVIDLDLSGTKADIIARLSNPDTDDATTSRRHRATPWTAPAQPTERRGRGRPRLGVIAREVTLLPRHWEWLAAQSGGASVALRRLVDEARRTGRTKLQIRAAQESTYRFMSAIAGDFPGFEEATRALFANDRYRFEQQITTWPENIRDYASQLAAGAFTTDTMDLAN
jgi:uncharacterized protein